MKYYFAAYIAFALAILYFIYAVARLNILAATV